MTRLRRHHATVVAYLALIIALAGVSYAAVSLPAASVGTKQLKANAVISSKVKNRSLVRADFKANQIPRGATGPTGPGGAPADPAPGPPAELAPRTPSCQTQPGTLCQTPLSEPGNPGWSSFSGGDPPVAPAAYFQDKAGFVHLQGRVGFVDPFNAAPGGFPIFYLPTALRPDDGIRKFWVTRCDGGSGGETVVVALDGAVKAEPFSKFCIALDDISFHP